MATYAARACEQFRAQGSLCKRVCVAIRSGMFIPQEAKFPKGVVCELPYTSDDTHLIIRAALQGLDAIFWPGYAYANTSAQRGEDSKT